MTPKALSRKKKPKVIHNWIPQSYFEYTTEGRDALLVLRCPCCGKYRYQYGSKIY